MEIIYGHAEKSDNGRRVSDYQTVVEGLAQLAPFPTREVANLWDHLGKSLWEAILVGNH